MQFGENLSLKSASRVGDTPKKQAKMNLLRLTRKKISGEIFSKVLKIKKKNINKSICVSRSLFAKK